MQRWRVCLSMSQYASVRERTSARVLSACALACAGAGSRMKARAVAARGGANEHRAGRQAGRPSSRHAAWCTCPGASPAQPNSPLRQGRAALQSTKTTHLKQADPALAGGGPFGALLGQHHTRLLRLLPLALLHSARSMQGTWSAACCATPSVACRMTGECMPVGGRVGGPREGERGEPLWHAAPPCRSFDFEDLRRE